MIVVMSPCLLAGVVKSIRRTSYHYRGAWRATYDAAHHAPTHHRSREAEDVPGGRRVESGGVAGGVRRVVSDGVVGVLGVVAGGVFTMPPGGHHQWVAHQRCCTTGRLPLAGLPRAAPGAAAIGWGGSNGVNSAAESAGRR
jgi:hypothetical protein